MRIPPAPLAPALSHPSPNHDSRKRPVSMILLHYTGMRETEAALARLSDPASKVSAHYLVDEGGGVLSLVSEHRRAWHSGESFWQGESDINSASIGVEIANGGHDFGCPDFPDAQIASVIALCRDIRTRHKIPRDRILAHSDVAPLRKKDPGEKFPWRRLADAGLGLWRAASSPGEVLWGLGDRGGEVRAFQERLAAFGYRMSFSAVYDEETVAVVSAFQRHFRPSRIDGFADSSTLRLLEDLASS